MKSIPYERMFIAGPSVVGGGWHKAFTSMPEFHQDQYHEYVLADGVASETAALKARVEELEKALERIGDLTPEAANAKSVFDLHITIKSIARSVFDKD